MAGKVKQLTFSEGVSVTAPTEVDLVDTTNAQTIGGVKTFSSEIKLTEIATPATPAAGYVSIYAKTDNKVYKKVPDGTESEIGTGGSGGRNYILNPSFEDGNITGWATYLDNDSVSFTDAGDLVTLADHLMVTGDVVSFTVITSTTGISISTLYYVIYVSSSTFKVASSAALASAGTALALTTNGTGTMVRAKPVNGTGGSATSTVAYSATTPLRQTGSMLFTKPASNRMGEGFSYAFTIDLQDNGKPVSVSFDASLSSGYTGSTGTENLAFYIYDVTTGAIIVPSAVNISPAISNFQVFFIAHATSVSYHLCIHVATVGAVAYTGRFDTFYTGPQSVSQGAAITDFHVPFNTQVILKYGSTTATNVTSYTTKYRQVGDSMELKTSILLSGAANAIGSMTVTLPDGLLGDAAKLTYSTSLSDLLCRSVLETGGKLYEGIAYYLASSNIITFYPTDATGSATTGVWTGHTTAGSNTPSGAALASGNSLNFVITIPIVGWSSNVTMANRAVERYFSTTEAFAATGSTLSEGFAGQATTNNAGTEYTKTVTHNVTNGTPTLELSSDSGVTWFDAADYAPRALSSAGTGIGAGIQSATSTAVVVKFGGYALMANDDAPTTDWGTGWRWRVKVTQPGAPVGFPISPANLVKSVVKYTNAAGTVITGSPGIIDFATKVYDTKSEVTTGVGSWKFTAKEAGYYRLTSNLLLTTGGGWAATEVFELSSYKNSALVQARGQYQTATHTTYMSGTIDDVIYCNSGEFIQIAAAQTSGANIALYASASHNWITIEQIN